MPGCQSVESEERGESGVCPTHPPPVPQGPCLMLLLLQKARLTLSTKTSGDRSTTPTPPSPHHIHLHRPLHCILGCAPASGPAEATGLPLLDITLYLPAFTEGESGSEKFYRGLPLREEAQVSPLDLLPSSATMEVGRSLPGQLELLTPVLGPQPFAGLLLLPPAPGAES